MGKIPISYKAYDNQYAAPMGISLSIGATCLIGGLMSNEISVFIIGIIGVVLFVILKILNYITAKTEAEENYEQNIAFLKSEVDAVLNDSDLTDDKKITKIIELSKAGNQYAMLFLSELAKRIEGEK